MNKETLEAMKKAVEELNKLSPEEFVAKLKEHEDGDIARILRYAWNPEEFLKEEDEKNNT